MSRTVESWLTSWLSAQLSVCFDSVCICPATNPPVVRATAGPVISTSNGTWQLQLLCLFQMSAFSAVSLLSSIKLRSAAMTLVHALSPHGSNINIESGRSNLLVCRSMVRPPPQFPPAPKRRTGRQVWRNAFPNAIPWAAGRS